MGLQWNITAQTRQRWSEGSTAIMKTSLSNHALEWGKRGVPGFCGREATDTEINIFVGNTHTAVYRGLNWGAGG